MPAGFQAFSQDGSNFLQIDGDYQNLFLRHKATLTSSPVSGALQPVSNVAWDVYCYGCPVVVLGESFPIAYDISPMSGQGYGNAGTYRIIFTMAGGAANFTVWLFDQLVSSELSNAGLVVYNAQGKPVFDMLRKPMRVVGLFDATGANGGYIDLPAGYSRLGVSCTSGFYTQNIGAPQLGYFRFGAVVNNNGTRPAIGNFLAGMSNSLTAYGGGIPTMGIAVDLSNY